MLVKVENDKVVKYPYTKEDLLQDYPNTSFPAYLSGTELAEYDVYFVKEVEQPKIEYTEIITEHEPAFLDGEWTQVWSVSPASQKQIDDIESMQATSVRNERNDLLSQSDYTQLLDAPSSINKEAWATYRQALRDITLQTGFPFTVTFPNKPE